MIARPHITDYVTARVQEFNHRVYMRFEDLNTPSTGAIDRDKHSPRAYIEKDDLTSEQLEMIRCLPDGMDADNEPVLLILNKGIATSIFLRASEEQYQKTGGIKGFCLYEQQADKGPS